LVWRFSRGYTLVWGLSLIVQGLVPAAIVYTTKWVVDAVAAAVGGGLSVENVELVLAPAAVMGALLVLQQGLASVSSWVQAAQAEVVQDKLKRLIHAKAVSVDYGFYESSEYFDLLQEANAQASARTLGVLRNLGTLVQSAITFSSIAVILATYSIWLPLVLLVGTLPAVGLVVWQNRKHHRWWKETTRLRRWTSYLDVLFVEPRFAAEMRLYDLGEHFMKDYQDTREGLRRERLRLLRDQNLVGIVALLQGLLVTAGIMVWMGWRALQGLATLGDLALFYQAINQGQSLMRSVLNSAGQIYTDTLFVEHLFQFLEIEPQLDEVENPAPMPATLRDGITFEAITFAYPGSREPAVEGFDLHVPAGKTTAIVGSNGAGKSTLIKLLCRFYDPQEGRVLADGVDVRSVSKSELRRQISVMFQHPVHYQATAFENIALGDLAAADRADVEAAARGAGAHELIERLPRAYETVLGRLFPEGTDLSGGQWQRVALARAYLRQAPILLLDEPTSFMDSWAEHAWLQRFKRLGEGRTVVIITHRFTTAMQADIIHVMEGGRIVESGSHEELVDRGGLYAGSWREQMRQSGREPTLALQHDETAEPASQT
jgi:ATP-binding cassette subfamily B protein